MTSAELKLKTSETLDPGFQPASLFFQHYDEQASQNPESTRTILALARPDGTCFHHSMRLLPDGGEFSELNERFIERTLKFLLWMQGGSRIHFYGPRRLADYLRATYSATGARVFDFGFIGQKIFREDLTVEHHDSAATLPPALDKTTTLGGHLQGCRIGFDLGGSDRKTAAVIDGKVVFSEEVPWDPYFQSDPNYHLEGIRQSLQSAAEHLPHVDAIGGSAAGVYINNEVRAASLFRGVTDANVFEGQVRNIFKDLAKEWNDVPFDVINDGEVTALAAALSLKTHSILGIAMGTSLAAGYCDPNGRITSWLNELAFCPVDMRPDAPADEWSGDVGCGVQCFSQQAVSRLAPAAGFDFGNMPFPEQLVEVQMALLEGHTGAARIFETIGNYLGHCLPLYARFYPLKHVLLLGRVTSGDGGEILLETAREVLHAYYPELAESIKLHTPDETNKRHGQAIAAASLPALV
ncbi:ROK family protein [Roseibacillus persicicus]|uniref:ROK family protein n=1 Tax=Roseibacillus persicicus TaxID=454148 RepID=UPI00280D0689|nr:ROK family protein [Roseibacillus persicicus]MDQ8190470.1 ROK family protein [Roseibacillus persicicus]